MDRSSASARSGGQQQSSLPAASSKNKQCLVCGEEIWVNARKCIHCNSDFGWRRFWNFSNTTLALLTALLAVIVAWFPLLASWLTPDKSVLSAQFIEISPTGNTISLLFNNAGRRHGAISNIWFTVAYATPDYKGSFSINPHSQKDVADVLDPDKSASAVYYFDQAPTHWESAHQDADFKFLSETGLWDTETEKYLTCEVDLFGTNSDTSPYNQKITVNDCVRQARRLFKWLPKNANGIKNVSAIKNANATVSSGVWCTSSC